MRERKVHGDARRNDVRAIDICVRACMRAFARACIYIFIYIYTHKMDICIKCIVKYIHVKSGNFRKERKREGKISAERRERKRDAA